jgi:DNA-binding LacI/PurR family transcriptional regulator
MTFVEKLKSVSLTGILLFEIGNPQLAIELRKLNRPLVSVDYDYFQFSVSSVVFDHLYGMCEATRRLIANGHRDIRFLRSLSLQDSADVSIIDPVEDERQKGYRLAMKSAGLPVRVEAHPPGIVNLRARLLEIFGGRPAPTALVCQSDYAAPNIIRELTKLGFRIPEDVSLVGFGDEGVEIGPGRKMATVAVDRRAMGEQAAQLLVSAIRGESGSLTRKIIEAEVKEYDSIARVARRRRLS